MLVVTCSGSKARRKVGVADMASARVPSPMNAIPAGGSSRANPRPRIARMSVASTFSVFGGLILFTIVPMVRAAPAWAPSRPWYQELKY